MRRYLRQWMVVLLLLSAFVLSAEAEESPDLNLELPSVSALTGEVISVPIELSENQRGFAGFTIRITYDTSILALDCTDTSADESTRLLSACEFGLCKGLQSARQTVQGTMATLTVSYVTVQNIVDTGTLFSLHFRVLQEGETDLTLSASKICDECSAALSARTENGSVQACGMAACVNGETVYGSLPTGKFTPVLYVPDTARQVIFAGYDEKGKLVFLRVESVESKESFSEIDNTGLFSVLKGFILSETHTPIGVCRILQGGTQ